MVTPPSTIVPTQMRPLSSIAMLSSRRKAGRVPTKRPAAHGGGGASSPGATMSIAQTRAVIVSLDVKRLAVGREADAVRAHHVGTLAADFRAVGGGVINGAMIAAAVAHLSMIGKPEAAASASKTISFGPFSRSPSKLS